MKKKELTSRKVAQAITDDSLRGTEQKLRRQLRRLGESYLTLRDVVKEQRATIAALQ